ncbi:MAG: alpha-2-macroglobulin family protein, partial [Limisphaerales bacterium]
MGQMHLRADYPHGTTQVRVEEYKRPKFQVSLDAPKSAPKLNELVSLTGNAMAYTGAAVDGAQVKYRVVREVRWPIWWHWGWRASRPRGSEEQEIANGTIRTEVDGRFQIEFVAKPDPTIPESDEPTFIYRIYADVTDNAGETRSDDGTINVGYTALQANMTGPEWLEENRLFRVEIKTETLDGEPQNAEGVVKLYELKAPEKVHRSPLPKGHLPYWHHEGPIDEEEDDQPDLSDPNNWPLGRVVAEKKFSTDKEGKANLEFKLKTGAYRIVLETKDRFGKAVTAKLPLQVLQPNAKRFAIRIPHFVQARTNSYLPGEEFIALWGTGYSKGRAFIEIEHRGRMIQSFWTKPEQTQEQIKLAVTEAMRGGFTLHVTQVRENRGYLTSERIDVPWSNKELEIRWEHFTSKLEPSQKETWTAVLSLPTNSVAAGKGYKELPIEQIAAEMVATLYDKSLDAFAPHQWMQRFNIFRQDRSTAEPMFQNGAQQFNAYWTTWHRTVSVPEMSYRRFPDDLTQNYWGYQSRSMRTRGVMKSETFSPGLSLGAPVPAAAVAQDAFFADRIREESLSVGAVPLDSSESPQPEGLNLDNVIARQNLNETAFFFPQLTSDSEGVVRMTFTMPEALTEWRFMGFAHDGKLRSGFIDGKTITAKDLMVQPNPPRFLREGDEVEFTVKVSNQSNAPQTGKVRLTFADGLTGKAVDELLGNVSAEQTFEIPAKESRSYSWRIKAPEELSVLTYKAVGATAKVSDGEEGFLPVLSRRILVTESLPLPIRGPATKNFEFTKLLGSGESDTLRHQNVTVQMVSNPSWYAVMALPYLMEFPYECSEQVFNRFYANALARHIANSDLKIKRIFEQWRGTPALDSPLEKNQELKSVVLEETPWVRQAQSESQARKNVGILFDDNRLNYETDRTLQKLAEMQHNDGAWPWFPGGPGNDFITLYI